MTTFMAQVRKQPAHIQSLAVDSTNYAHVPRLVWPFQGDPGNFARPSDVDTLLDLGAIAAKDPIVAAAFQHSKLAPAQYLPFVTALQHAEEVEAREILMLEADTLIKPADSASLVWKNVAFLRSHRAAVNAMELPLSPSLLLDYKEADNFQYFLHYLDTTQHPASIRYLANPNNGMDPEPWPFGFLDSTDAPKGAATTRPWRVLFVGNSFTYYNTMPRLFSKLAAYGLHRRVVVGLVAIPGGRPIDLLFGTDLSKVLAAFPWDAVVVQLRPSHRFYGQTLPYYAPLYTQAITAHHAQTVLWTNWTGPSIDEKARIQRMGLDSIMNKAAKAAGATLAPSEQAWEAVRLKDDSTWKALYGPEHDGHPSQLGSYLISLVLYRALTGRSPIGLPRKFDSLSLGPLHTTDSLTVPAKVAELLQGVAATARP
jgi:hypothetical protein